MNEYIKINFRVKKINFRDASTRYAICRVSVLDYECESNISSEITIKGSFPSVYEGDEYTILGRLKFDDIYGAYIEGTSIPEIILPSNKKTLAEFMTKRVRGLGIKKSAEIVDYLGLGALSKIKDNKKVLLDIKGITEKKANSIYEQLIEHETFEQLSMFLQGINIDSRIALKIYERFKENSLSIIKSNPYSICYDNEIAFNHADKIASNLNIPFDNEFRIRTAILNYLNYRSNSIGDMCVYKDILIDEFNNYLKINGCYPDDTINIDIINSALDDLSPDSITSEMDNEGNLCIYTGFLNYVENSIVKNLKRILTTWKNSFCSKEQIDKFLIDYESKYLTLDKKQKDAVYMALQSSLSILTGGPGVGKTQTTNTIVQCILSINPYARIKLLAPTGKASARMTELTSMKSSTIHRSLKINPYDISKALEEIDCDFVFIDESSMIDAPLFEKLIQSISDNTRVVLIGDVNQLPSVGCGNILKDLIESEVIPTTILTTVFRQGKGSEITTNSYKIIEGYKTTDVNGVDVSNAKGSNFIFWEESSVFNIRKNLMLSIDRLINGYHMRIEDICILTPMKKGDLGSIELNRILQNKLNPQSSDKAEYEIDALRCFRVGDRVMQNTNNYDLGVFNGDVGNISKIYTDVSSSGVIQYMIEVTYPQLKHEVTYTESEFSEIELCYAMTIHKSQGSEFPAVIMPIHRSQENMLYRNLVYTGVSRAKEMIICIVEKVALDLAISKIDATIRISRLREKLYSLKDCI